MGLVLGGMACIGCAIQDNVDGYAAAMNITEQIEQARKDNDGDIHKAVEVVSKDTGISTEWLLDLWDRTVATDMLLGR